MSNAERTGPRTVLVPLLLVLLPPATALALLGLTDGLTATSLPGLPDPGAVVRWALPAVTALRDASAAVAVGTLVLATVCVPTDTGTGGLSTAQEVLRRATVVAVAGWAGANATLVALAYSDASGATVRTPGFWSQTWYFAREFDLGRYSLGGCVLTAALLLTVVGARRPAGLGFAALLAMAGLWPIALAGHASGALDHDRLVDIQMYHLVGVTVWIGGLVGLLLVRRRLDGALATVTRRYSRIAGWCLLLVAVSGVVGAVLRLPNNGALLSSYGALLAVKTVVLGAVALLGLWQRRRLLRLVEDGAPRAFVRIVRLEVALLLVGAGAGVALARTGPPAAVDDLSPTAAELLIGRPLPPALDTAGWFTAGRPDLLWLPLALLMWAAYVTGVQRLTARGDRWPMPRTLSWTAGWLLVAWATSGAPGVYGKVLFSQHLVQYLVVATVAPVLLVLGAPVTLGLRALPRRADDSFGPLEWLQELLRSFYALIVTSPIVASAVFVASLPVFYSTGILELALESHTVHQLMLLHLLLAGYVFANCLVGRDPGVVRPTFRFRWLLLLVAIALQARFLATLGSTDEVLAGDWFGSLQRDWGVSLADDQALGASFGWILGEVPLIALGGILLVRWLASNRRAEQPDEREAHDEP